MVSPFCLDAPVLVFAAVKRRSWSQLLCQQACEAPAKSLESQLLLKADTRRLNVSHCPPELPHVHGTCLLQASHLSSVSKSYLAVTV